jgi:hypothetical protein
MSNVGNLREMLQRKCSLRAVRAPIFREVTGLSESRDGFLIDKNGSVPWNFGVSLGRRNCIRVMRAFSGSQVRV